MNPNDVAKIRHRLRGVGLRSTIARISLVYMLEHSNAPMSLSDLFEQVQLTVNDRSTIARVLRDLEGLGFCRRIENVDGVRYTASERQTSIGSRSNPPFSCRGFEPAFHSPRNSENQHLHGLKFYSIAIATLVYRDTRSFSSRVRNRTQPIVYESLKVVRFLSFPINNGECKSWTNRSFGIRKKR
jgi:Fe2+ or Zn2+ uptake regulation protein